MKSNVSDCLELMDCIYRDATIKCIADVSDKRDLLTIRSRVKEEGLSFLTITLPKFCQDFEKSLAEGVVDAKSFARWKTGKDSVMPAFLQGITRHLFSLETGKVINDESSPFNRGFSDDFPTLVESVRQICLTFKKIEMECTPKRVASAFENFISIEQSFEKFLLSEEERSKFLDVSSVLWDSMVSSFTTNQCIPKHGPGATADKFTGNRKYQWQLWYDRVEPYFPLIDNGYPLGTPVDSEELEQVTIVSEADEQPVRVISVPKTLKSPRIIAIEPCCMQYVQQGIKDWLCASIESYWLTSGHVNFRDQSVNQKLAMSSSMTGRFATIDLSDASDRVPRDLAMEMFRANPDLFGSIEACRSTSAQLPDGRIVSPLRKFASMGSALCFPIEAMYFYTVCVVALLDCMNLPATSRNIYNVSRELYIYGDDIIVTRVYAIDVLDYLQKYNCKVNVNKTFVSGSFRESCGVDAFNGYQVTPVYLNQMRPEDIRQSDRIISWTATSNLFYKKGYWATAQFMRNALERIVGNLPYVSDDCSGLGRYSYLGYRSIERWNYDLQRFEVRTLVPRPVYRTDRLEGYGALMKCFVSMSSQCYDDVLIECSLEQTVLRGAVTLRRRWVRP